MFKIIPAMVMAALCLFFESKGRNIKPLKIGDTIPDAIWNMPLQIVNHPAGKKTIVLNDYKNKLIILDFWATWCGPCVNGLPKLFALQTKFKGQFQVVLVNSKSTRDTRDKISTFFNQRNHIYQLFSVVSDDFLKSSFPHKSIPHYVWIKDGVIKAITSSEEVNQKNIEDICSNSKNEIAEKKEVKFNSEEPLFVDGNGGNPENYAYRSFLTGYIDGLTSSSGVKYEESEMAIRIFSTNSPILYLYQQAYPKYRGFDKNRIIYDVSDPANYSLDSNSHSWKSKNFYNYEALFPPRSLSEAEKIMQQDLKRYFNFCINVENRETPCLVLKVLTKTHFVEDVDSTAPATNIYEKDGSQKYLKNYPLISLVSYLNSILKIPLIDETGIKENISVQLPADLSNESLLRESLIKYGISLKKETREMKFLIISDNTNSKY